MAPEPPAAPVPVPANDLGEPQHFGAVLREARERRSVALADVSRRTKVPEPTLRLLEAGRLDDLPPEVFVRGFIRSYARAVGTPEAEPLGLFDQAVAARRRAEEAALLPAEAAGTAGGLAEDDGLAPRRGIGIAVFVIIVLLIATITLSLFLRQPPQSGEGLSLGGVPASESMPVRGEPGAGDARPIC